MIYILEIKQIFIYIGLYFYQISECSVTVSTPVSEAGMGTPIPGAGSIPVVRAII